MCPEVGHWEAQYPFSQKCLQAFPSGVRTSALRKRPLSYALLWLCDSNMMCVSPLEKWGLLQEQSWGCMFMHQCRDCVKQMWGRIWQGLWKPECPWKRQVLLRRSILSAGWQTFLFPMEAVHDVLEYRQWVDILKVNQQGQKSVTFSSYVFHDWLPFLFSRLVLEASRFKSSAIKADLSSGATAFLHLGSWSPHCGLQFIPFASPVPFWACAPLGSETPHCLISLGFIFSVSS